ncbi:hypothetical protein [uncultured Alistipes sp.]|uniref:hypothetical protein n=1 Tax=uncultured Alistipes sp. TaxID=538949 RepID=UPI00272CE80B|nr:hypothetical protein [uncultured Alistipes sp.]
MKEPYINIIEMMKYACETLERFNKKHRKLNVDEETERELEKWSGNLRCHATTLNSRIIYQ